MQRLREVGSLLSLRKSATMLLFHEIRWQYFTSERVVIVTVVEIKYGTKSVGPPTSRWWETGLTG